MSVITIKNNIRETQEQVFKEYLKPLGFRYDKYICLIYKRLKQGTIKVDYAWDAGTFIGWTIIIWNNNFETIYEKVFQKTTEFDYTLFENAFYEAKRYLKNYEKN